MTPPERSSDLPERDDAHELDRIAGDITITYRKGDGTIQESQTLTGVAAGALILALLENGLAAYTSVPTSLQDAVSFALLFVVLVALPRGLPGLLSRFERGTATR